MKAKQEEKSTCIFIIVPSDVMKIYNKKVMVLTYEIIFRIFFLISLS